MSETPPSSRRLLICADDYAISPAVSAGIRELALAGRLSATGVMTCMRHWSAEAPALRPLVGRIAVGLHFTLTDQAPLGPMPVLAPAGRLPPIARLVTLGLFGRLPGGEIAAELDRQLDAFESHFGAPPDFIDGHQHVHLFPGVWPLVLAAFDRRLDPRRCWLRDCTETGLWRRPDAVKAAIIDRFGRALARGAKARGIRCNRGFSGFYDIGRHSLAEAFPAMVAGAADGHLLMVHPGHVDEALRACDSLTEPRQAEWDFLAGPDLPACLERLGLVIAGRETPP